MSGREAVPQELGDLTGAAAGVEHPFVAAQIEALDHLRPPPRHGDGQAVVLGRVPVSGTVAHPGNDSTRR